MMKSHDCVGVLFSVFEYRGVARLRRFNEVWGSKQTWLVKQSPVLTRCHSRVEILSLVWAWRWKTWPRCILSKWLSCLSDTRITLNQHLWRFLPFFHEETVSSHTHLFWSQAHSWLKILSHLPIQPPDEFFLCLFLMIWLVLHELKGLVFV